MGFDQDGPVCIAAFILWGVISLACDIRCGFGEVILKMEVKEIGADITFLYWLGRNWALKGWGSKRWGGAQWGYSEREAAVQVLRVLYLKGILNPFL